MNDLRRLILEFSPDGIRLRTLYRSKDGPNPGTVRRRREVEQLARTGLEQALDAGETEMVGTAGFETRERGLQGLITPLLLPPHYLYRGRGVEHVQSVLHTADLPDFVA